MNKKVKLILSKAVAFAYIFILNLFHTRKKVNSGKVLIYSSHYFSNYNWKKVVKLPVNTML